MTQYRRSRRGTALVLLVAAGLLWSVGAATAASASSGRLTRAEEYIWPDCVGLPAF